MYMDFIRAPNILEFLILSLISLHRTNLCLFKSLILYVKDVITSKSLRMTITVFAKYIPFIPLHPFFNSSILPQPALCLERLTCMNFVRAPLPSGGNIILDLPGRKSEGWKRVDPGCLFPGLHLSEIVLGTSTAPLKVAFPSFCIFSLSL